MLIARERILYLLARRADQTSTGVEARELLDWLAENDEEEVFGEHVQQLLNEYPSGQLVEGVDWSRLYQGILEKRTPAITRPVHRIHFLKTGWFRYAAIFLLLFGISAYLWNLQQDRPIQIAQNPDLMKTDIGPGKQGAILTLADGSSLMLDSLGNGIIATQNGSDVALTDGRLTYGKTATGIATKLSYNTMTTPKGRQFQLVLPDGSKAWLNAASSITYPTAFNGEERSVKINGEVYFEIAKDLNKPFKVKVDNDNEIQVLATGFNVKAYTDDPLITTTLLEGAVRLSAFDKIQTLKPGQQTQVNADGKLKLVNHADIAKIMAWKNGLFNFQDESLEEVMKQLERWYDIKVQYIGNPPAQKFYGELQRDLTLSQVIEALKEIGIQFKIQGRTLIVMPS